MSVRKNKNLARRIHIFLLAGAMAFVTAAPVYAIPTNTQLPSGFESMLDNSTYDKAGNTGNIHQTGLTAVNKWGDFSIGADAVVNFTSDTANFNSVNFVNNGKVSEIYGQINANGGNIFLANTAGVQIGGSAQINVGSLYVTNKDLSSISSSLSTNSNMDTIKNSIANVKTTNAELMSLGGIVTEGNVTFDGDRVVIDVDHLYKNTDGAAMDTGKQLTIKTTDTDNVVLGYTAYDETNKYDNTNANKQIQITADSTVNNLKGYMWVENLLQLQAMETKLDGNYALRNSIDANFSADSEYNYAKDKNNVGKGFASIGNSTDKFIGRFDGLGYDIFDLNVKDGQDYAGLFGYVDGAIIRNFTLNSGSVAGGENTGAAVGYANNSTSSNIINTADVTGTSNVGGLVGYAENSKLDGLVNTGTVTGTNSNIGGIAGNITGSSITGETYNLGAVKGDNTTNTTFNVGGIVGRADASTIGNKSENGEDVFVIYNELTVTGGYNVGGIAGQITDSNTADDKTMVVQNVANEGAVLAEGAKEDAYYYHTASAKAGDDTGASYDSNTGIVNINVKAANAGGIVGNADNASVSNAENSGNVTTAMTENSTTGNYYNAGNVGGIVGRAENTNITTVVNKENDVAGAHNVGGAVGYLTGNSKVDGAINNGGDITATGARRTDNTGFAQESIRNYEDVNQKEIFNIGNIGGIVGYMYGDNTQIANSANRGTVHSAYIDKEHLNNVLTISKAANVGGIVGKLDTNKKYSLSDIKNNVDSASITGSYNTGDVQGYTGVGGVIGFMYNGSVAESYNLGTIKTTRKASTSSGSQEALNMGGIVGDTTEGTDARAIIYDVYNTGQIGDETFNLYGRHIGGIVGRLSGTVEKSYNTGDIYNGFNVVGGIAGYWYAGTINNTFNTGNITVVNNNDAESQVGGIVGAADLSTSIGTGAMKLSNSYNLGTLRSFRPYREAIDKNNKPYNANGENKVGGIIGYLVNWDNKQDVKLTIDSVYTLGNLYAATQQPNDSSYTSSGTTGVGAIVGGQDNNTKFQIGDIGAFYIKPEADKGFSAITTTANGVKIIAFEDRYKAESYKSFQADGKTYNGFNFSSQDGGDVEINTGEDWRIYDGTTPILNAFLPNAEDYFDQFNNSESLKEQGINSIQYGTAFNPLLTIINANQNAALSYDWIDLGITGAAGLAVYGNDSLTLNGFATSGANKYFGGTIYSDGSLNLNGTGDNFNLGSGSKLYGSSVTLDANTYVVDSDGNYKLDKNGNKIVDIYGDMTVYGSVTSTDGDIAINGDNIEIIGNLTAATEGEQTTIAGISSKPASMDTQYLNDPGKSMQSITDRFTHTTDEAEKDGNITITANGTAEVLYGHLGTGKVTSGGSLSVTGNDSVYIDTDLHIGGNLNLTSNGEMLIDLSNMGDISKENLHKEFLDHFKTKNSGGKGAEINISGSDDFKIAIDLWDNNSFKLDKYDIEHTLTDDINNLQITSKNENINGKSHTYIWIDSAEQLKGIQDYYTKNNKDEAILGYNFALKNDIDASVLTGYEAIGTGSTNGFTGTFDGRDNRIIGLTVGEKNADGGSTSSPSSAGIFSTVSGTVQDLRIYASNFYGMDYAGAVAGINNGTITGITTLGNHVEAFGSSQSESLITNDAQTGTTTNKNVGAAGGIAGLNSGKISDSFASDSVIAGDPLGNKSTGGLNNTILATAGGIAGINDGEIENVTADSAITANKNTTYSLGGITGFNRNGSIYTAYNTGVTHGEYGDGNITSNSVGGIAGVNTGSISNVYNSADITGGNYVGGIVGYNHKVTNDLNGQITIPENSGQISNAVNAGDILADFTYTDTNGEKHNYEYTGGLAGYNSGSISSGRNTGEIYGGDYVGGMVGANQVIKDEKENVIEGSGELSNLSNSVFATITGESYVGGIAGQNYGNINATDSAINNYGKVYGQHFVGGIAGVNKEDGVIANTISSISLYVKNENSTEDPADFFGGVVGQNSGIINGATNASSVDVAAAGATYVGGIIGQNTATGTLQGEIANEGTVSGLSNVGGIIGENKNASILNNSDNNERLQITNSGNVSATKGGAAGIFYKNNITGHEGDINANAINNADITNTGTVTGGTDENSVTGGLFGYNSGNITNSTLTNSGIVTGGGTVGGLIGENTGNISKSSLKNEAGATVIGIKNVGGLIGKNTGTIEGGRDDNNSYYKYQIYNNGVINVGTWNDGNNDGIVDAGEIGALTDTVTSTNIGGLIGSNEGNLTAGYNTGTINAGDSTNVGGIVGNNAGTVDQVFNTIFNSDGTNGTITGATKVGGIIGSNSGHLSNAYNTTEVVANEINGVIGAIAGSNTALGTIDTVFTTTGDSVVGNINNGTVSNALLLSNAANAAKDADNYKGFGFSTDDTFSKNSDDDIWKIYDGKSLAMLKVFLTSATVEDTDFVYNGSEQSVTIDKITSADNNKAYENNNNLINFIGHKDAGSYSDWLYSGQIASSGTVDTFNPNNLGYDITYTDSIDKAKLSISDILANIVYGGNTYTDITGGTLNGIINEDDVYLTLNDNKLDITSDLIKQYLSDSYKNVQNGRNTADVNRDQDGNIIAYNNAIFINEVKISGNDAGNYELYDNTINGGIKVTPANLTINLGDISRVYGNLDSKNYANFITHSGLVNGDTGISFSITSDGAITDGTLQQPAKTNDVGDYGWTAQAVSGDTFNTNNYNITYTGNGTNGTTGKSTVTKKLVTIGANDVQINLGQKPNYTGTDINDVLVNGDKFTNDYHYGVEDSAIENTVGTHVDSIGIWIGNSFYELSEESNWTGSGMDAFFSNYNITFTPGTLTVGEKVEPDYNWDYLYNDNPFDRLKNFRERKAEINFVDGGMEI